MKLGLAIQSNLEQDKSSVIIQFSDALENFFKNKNYGDSVKMYTVGIVCMSPQFLQFFKSRKPNYTKGKKSFAPDGILVEIEDALEYDINIDFETFKNGTEAECRKLLAKEVLQSLKVLDDMKGKIKDFNTEQFKADLENFFKEKELI